MNKLYRLPLRTRAKNLSSGVRRRRNSSKIVVTSLLAVGALALLGVIGLAALFTFKHLTAKPKVIAAAPSPVATTPPATPALKAKEILLPLSDPNKAAAEGSASAPAAVSPGSSPLVLTSTFSPTPALSPAPTPTVSPQEQKTDSKSTVADKPLTKAARKNLEKRRSEAERKRARLEKMYHNHDISTDAYNKGKEEYKVEIQKYRDELKSGN